MIRLSPERDGAWIGAAAALSLLATLAMGIGALLHSASVRIEAQAHVVTVAIAAADGAQQNGRAEAMLAMLRRRGDLADAHGVDPAIVRADAGVSGDVPVPALIDATVKAGGSIDDIRRAIAGLPGVSLTDDGASFDAAARQIGSFGTTARVIGILAILCGLAIGAARGWQEHALADTLARLGADTRQIALVIGLLAGRAVLIGGTAGLIPGVIALPFIAAQAAGIDKSGMTGIGIEGAWTLAAIPPLLALIAAVAGGAAALRRLKRPR